MNDEPLTQKQFDKIPLLVPRRVFMRWTGYSWRDINFAKESGEISTYRVPGKQQEKFCKKDIARIGGLSM